MHIPGDTPHRFSFLKFHFNIIEFNMLEITILGNALKRNSYNVFSSFDQGLCSLKVRKYLVLCQRMINLVPFFKGDFRNTAII